MRKVTNWNKEWEFIREDIFTEAKEGEALQDANSVGSDKAWDKVTLPHTWNALDGQDGGNDYYKGRGWYRKIFQKQDGAVRTYVRFEAVSKKADVWCNGTYVGGHEGGFSAFTLDLTDDLKDGDNELLVRADNGKDLPIYPMNADFTFYGGIYRNVELITFNNECHFNVTDFGTDAILVTPKADGEVSVRLLVGEDSHIALGKAAGKESNGQCCKSDNKNLTVNVKIYDAGHNIVGEAEANATGDDTLSVKVNNPHLWNGLDDPYMYTAEAELTDGSIVLDKISASFGFRSFNVDPEKGFYLNGVSYPLHGVSRHQDREDKGWAISEDDHRQDMEIIRDMGANTVRLAHYQHAAYFFDLCDTNGMVVWAEIPFISVYDTRDAADDNLRIQMRELLLQNYNHPSICFWGVANEIGIAGESERMYDMVRELNDMARDFDKTRLTAIANVGMTKPDSPLFHITDLTSYNEYKGWYEGTADDHGPFVDEAHGQLGTVPLAISEYGADAVLKWHSETPKVKDYTEEYQAVVHEKAMKAFNARPYLWATWLWNMFDFGADNRDEGGCKGRNNKGLVSYDRKVRKEAFYFYKALWCKEPFLHVCGQRFVKHSDEHITVKAYSNCKEVSLYANGDLVATLSGDTVFEFKDVPLKAGSNEITVKAGDSLADTVTFEKVDSFPDEYVYKEEKLVSSNVAQWFADLQKESGSAARGELEAKEGYLSVFDPLEEVYRYPEGFKAVQEIIAKPMSIDHPEMAKRMDKGGPMSFKSIWNHISKLLPDEAIYILNDRLSEIKK